MNYINLLLETIVYLSKELQFHLSLLMFLTSYSTSFNIIPNIY